MEHSLSELRVGSYLNWIFFPKFVVFKFILIWDFMSLYYLFSVI